MTSGPSRSGRDTELGRRKRVWGAAILALALGVIIVGVLIVSRPANPSNEAPSPAATADSESTPTSTPVGADSVPTAVPASPPAMATAATPADGGSQSDTLKLLYWQAPVTANPYLTSAYKDRDAAAITLEPLAKISPDGTLVPSLATHIPTVVNGGITPDHTSVTWALTPGVMWSDGSPFTADDVVFTWRYCVDLGARCGSRFEGVTNVSALDDLSARILYEAPQGYPYRAFVGTASPILSRAQFSDCMGPVEADACTTENLAPVGTGPYRIVRFTAGDSVLYVPNPHYRGAAPAFDDVQIVSASDAESAARAVLETGAADFAWNVQVPPADLARMEAAGMGVVVTALAGVVERIVVNHADPDPGLGDDSSEYLDGANPHPFLTYAPIPQAMSMAIDRRHITDRLYGASGQPVCAIIVAPAMFASPPDDGCLTQDIDGANALLDRSGVVDTNGDGIREYNAVPLRVRYQTTRNAIRQATQNLISDWWRMIGIRTELIDHDAVDFFGDPQQEASYLRFSADLQMYATDSGIDPQGYLAGERCSEIQTRSNGWAGGNNSRACSPANDALYERLAAARSADARVALVRQLHDVIIRTYHAIPLVLRGLTSAHATSLRGVEPNGWDGDLWNIAEWAREAGR